MNHSRRQKKFFRNYLKERNFRVNLFSQVIFFLRFRVDLISPIGYRRISREDLILRIW